MSRVPLHRCPARARRAQLLRRALVELARREGRFRGHVLRRVTQRVGSLPRPGRLQAIGLRTSLIESMPSVHLTWTGLGLGLAGGGGGSPGSIAIGRGQPALAAGKCN